MATLKDGALDTFIDINLKETHESPDWIGYNIIAYTKKDNIITEVLKLRDSHDFSFENFADPEIPALCNALDSMAKSEINTYVFEPVDEKDFRLEIRHEITGYGDFFVTNFFMCHPILLGNYQWRFRSSVGLQLNLTKGELIDFATELRREYNNLGKSESPAKG